MEAGSEAPGVGTLRAGDASVVIDSWRVAHGRVLAFGRHRARFEEAVAASFRTPGNGEGERRVLPDRDAWGAFWDRVRNGVPRAGEWFPRVSARLVHIRVPDEEIPRPCVELDFELRPAPPRRLETKLMTLRDGRRFPRIKGADLSWCAQARERAVAAGADDALLTGDDGLVLEAAHGAILGWRDGVCLLPPERDGRLLQSVTVSVLAGLLPRLGVPTERGSFPRRQLPEGPGDAEAGALPSIDGIWYVNALHGVSPVTAVDGQPMATDAALARTVQRALEARRAPL